jgi:hypothetical protein
MVDGPQIGAPLNFPTIGTGGGGALNTFHFDLAFNAAGLAANYYCSIGPLADLVGNAASDWEVLPGTPGVSSDTLRPKPGSGRVSALWIASFFLQQGPSAGIPRAFLSAFKPGPIGDAGGAVSLSGNNFRANGTLISGGVTELDGVYWQVGWNGNTPLQLIAGSRVVVVST